MPERFAYGALLAYSPRGTSAVSVRSRDITYNIKNDIPPIISQVARSIREDVNGALSELFEPDTLLVPAPRSSLITRDSLWPSQRICEEIHACGLSGGHEPLLRRTRAIPKASTSALGARPSVDAHMHTMSVDELRPHPRSITVVDDVVTKGISLAACVARLQHVFPRTIIRGFAVVRTRGLIAEITEILDPVIGVISCSGGQIKRDH